MLSSLTTAAFQIIYVRGCEFCLSKYILDNLCNKYTRSFSVDVVNNKIDAASEDLGKATSTILTTNFTLYTPWCLNFSLQDDNDYNTGCRGS
jgi:hypothetical protein